MFDKSVTNFQEEKPGSGTSSDTADGEVTVLVDLVLMKFTQTSSHIVNYW